MNEKTMSMNGSIHSTTLSNINTPTRYTDGWGASPVNTTTATAGRLTPSNTTVRNSRSSSNSTRSSTERSSTATAIMNPERERVLVGTDPIGSGERVSTERKSDRVSTEPPGILRESSGPRKLNTEIPHVLPHERVFPIQIGSELFRLSGASISSDAPSYFSQFFQCQLETARENGDHSNSVRTLYIDRDPVTFKDISLHLQGYHVRPKDGTHFVKLFADAQFYSLPRLISQLYEESIFISIGHRDFQIPRELFSDPGNSPNYFSLGFAVFFTSPAEIFPGLSREGLLRPPSIIPPSVPNRSAATFEEILHLLRGYPVQLRSEDHRAELLRDCRYFHLKGLEQKLIRHAISFNLNRKRQEIVLRLEDVRQSGISVIGDPFSSEPPTPTSSTTSTGAFSHFPPSTAPPSLVGYVNYARPFVDSQPYELVLEIGCEETKLHLGLMRAEFYRDSKARISKLFDVIATKLNLPTTQPLGLLMKTGGRSSQPASPGNSGVSEDLVRVVLGEDCAITLDGKEWKGHLDSNNGSNEEEHEGINTPSMAGTDDWLNDQLPLPNKKRKRGPDTGSMGFSTAAGGFVGGAEEWIIKTGQWRLRVQNSRNSLGANGGVKGGIECVLVGVRIEAFSSEYGRNGMRGFLAG